MKKKMKQKYEKNTKKREHMEKAISGLTEHCKQ